MSILSSKAKNARVAAAVAATLASGSLVVHNPGPAAADPPAVLIGVGSDTTQDVMNALAGFNNGIGYTPVRSSAASGNKQLASWDAVPVGSCITPKAGGPSFDRPNGSTNGRRALSRAIDGALWGTPPTCGSTGKSTSGIVAFARSSAGPSGAGTALTYVPFGRDAMSFASYRTAGGAATALTGAQLQSLYTTGRQTIGGIDTIPCLPQTGSGTRQFWISAMGTNDATATTATAACGGTVQENDATGLKNKGDALNGASPGVQVVVPFSAANFISQSNGVAPSQLVAGVDLGEIDALGKPYAGTAPNLTPSAGFYASTTYGRNVYNVLDTAKATGAGNNDFKTLFVGPTSAVCSAAAQTTVNSFGFLSVGGCGSTTLTGPLVN